MVGLNGRCECEVWVGEVCRREDGCANGRRASHVLGGGWEV